MKINYTKVVNELNGSYSIHNLIIGQFEFIHKGHLKLINNLDNFSFLTFDNNPSKSIYFFDINHRIKNLKKLNPEYIFIFDISKNNMDALDFINNYLKKINPKKIIVGSDFYFGKNKSGNVSLLSKYFDIEVIERDLNYSSKNILEMLKIGELESSLKLLDVPIYFQGLVVKNNQMGRQLGYPTANLVVDRTCEMLHGSYISKVFYNNKEYKGLSFLGNSKTLNSNKLFFETFIFDFNENIYDKEIVVFPQKFIRGNTKFNNKDELIKNINSDAEIAKIYFENMQ